jgi:hypothetical protein
LSTAGPPPRHERSAKRRSTWSPRPDICSSGTIPSPVRLLIDSATAGPGFAREFCPVQGMVALRPALGTSMAAVRAGLQQFPQLCCCRLAYTMPRGTLRVRLQLAVAGHRPGAIRIRVGPHLESLPAGGGGGGGDGGCILKKRRTRRRREPQTHARLSDPLFGYSSVRARTRGSERELSDPHLRAG